jgi:hypothetical protein
MSITMSEHKQQIGIQGPFEVPLSDAPSDIPEDELPRELDCSNYERCLDLAAALNWESFTCKGCCGEINECLTWRARQISRKDSMVRALCGTPKIETVPGSAVSHKKAENS